MPFLNGRMTFSRFSIDGAKPAMFGPEHLDLLQQHAIGTQATANGDGSESGWIAGDHILDTRFDLEKNIINDALHFALRIDTQAIPGDLIKAYTLSEIAAFASQNPSGFASAKQKKEARLIARERAEEESKDGRFRRRKMIPILWDRQSNQLLVGTTSNTALDRVYFAFGETFGHELVRMTAGKAALLHAPEGEVAEPSPSLFVRTSPEFVAWSDTSSGDFLGNEFLVWLWHVTENASDTIRLPDDSEVCLMMSSKLSMECPLGQYGKQNFSSDGPSRLPESKKAIQSGRLPRKAGLIMVRHDQQYEFAIQAENLDITGAKMPPVEGESERACKEERVTQIRGFLETLDLLYGRFCEVRLGLEWGEVVQEIREWLGQKVEEVAA